MATNFPNNLQNNNNNNNNNAFAQIPSLTFPATLQVPSAAFSSQFHYHAPILLPNLPTLRVSSQSVLTASPWQQQQQYQLQQQQQQHLQPQQHQHHQLQQQQQQQQQQQLPFLNCCSSMQLDQSGSVEENSAEDGAKGKMRVLFGPSQIARLERAFKESPFINRQKRFELAQLCGLRADQVKIWFQNKRYKQKRRAKDAKFLYDGKTINDIAPFNIPSPLPQLLPPPTDNLCNIKSSPTQQGFLGRIF